MNTGHFELNGGALAKWELPMHQGEPARRRFAVRLGGEAFEVTITQRGAESSFFLPKEEDKLPELGECAEVIGALFRRLVGDEANGAVLHYFSGRRAGRSFGWSDAWDCLKYAAFTDHLLGREYTCVPGDDGEDRLATLAWLLAKQPPGEYTLDDIIRLIPRWRPSAAERLRLSIGLRKLSLNLGKEAPFAIQIRHGRTTRYVLTAPPPAPGDVSERQEGPGEVDVEAGWAEYRRQLLETHGCRVPEWKDLPLEVRECFAAGVWKAIESVAAEGVVPALRAEVAQLKKRMLASVCLELRQPVIREVRDPSSGHIALQQRGPAMLGVRCGWAEGTPIKAVVLGKQVFLKQEPGTYEADEIMHRWEKGGVK